MAREIAGKWIEKPTAFDKEQEHGPRLTRLEQGEGPLNDPLFAPQNFRKCSKTGRRYIPKESLEFRQGIVYNVDNFVFLPDGGSKCTQPHKTY